MGAVLAAQDLPAVLALQRHGHAAHALVHARRDARALRRAVPVTCAQCGTPSHLHLHCLEPSATDSVQQEVVC